MTRQQPSENANFSVAESDSGIILKEGAAYRRSQLSSANVKTNGTARCSSDATDVASSSSSSSSSLDPNSNNNTNGYDNNDADFRRQQTQRRHFSSPPQPLTPSSDDFSSPPSSESVTTSAKIFENGENSEKTRNRSRRSKPRSRRRGAAEDENEYRGAASLESSVPNSKKCKIEQPPSEQDQTIAALNPPENFTAAEHPVVSSVPAVSAAPTNTHSCVNDSTTSSSSFSVGRHPQVSHPVILSTLSSSSSLLKSSDHSSKQLQSSSSAGMPTTTDENSFAVPQKSLKTSTGHRHHQPPPGDHHPSQFADTLLSSSISLPDGDTPLHEPIGVVLPPLTPSICKNERHSFVESTATKTKPRMVGKANNECIDNNRPPVLLPPVPYTIPATQAIPGCRVDMLKQDADDDATQKLSKMTTACSGEFESSTLSGGVLHQPPVTTSPDDLLTAFAAYGDDVGVQFTDDQLRGLYPYLQDVMAAPTPQAHQHLPPHEPEDPLGAASALLLQQNYHHHHQTEMLHPSFDFSSSTSATPPSASLSSTASSSGTGKGNNALPVMPVNGRGEGTGTLWHPQGTAAPFEFCSSTGGIHTGGVNAAIAAVESALGYDHTMSAANNNPTTSSSSWGLFMGGTNGVGGMHTAGTHFGVHTGRDLSCSTGGSHVPLSSSSKGAPRARFVCQEERMIAQRRRNRQSAQAHRDRQKRHLSDLAVALQRLVVENEDLVRSNVQLTKANSALMDRLREFQELAGLGRQNNISHPSHL